MAPTRYKIWEPCGAIDDHYPHMIDLTEVTVTDGSVICVYEYWCRGIGEGCMEK